MKGLILVSLAVITMLGVILMLDATLYYVSQIHGHNSKERIAAYHEDKETERVTIEVDGDVEIANIEADAVRDTSLVHVMDKYAKIVIAVGVLFFVTGAAINARKKVM